MTSLNFYTTIKSPIGEIVLTSDGTYLNGVYINNVSIDEISKKALYKPEIFNDTIRELNEYFAGTRQKFTVPIKQKGTNFQKLVWQKLQTIDYGKTISYKELASLSGKKKAYRAVGSANSKNRINIIVPCHRVVSIKGDLGGYNCGSEIKKWLLAHEQILCKSSVYS